jgi:hypothetical protein
MSLENWAKNGWLRPHRTTASQIDAPELHIKVLDWLHQDHPNLISN